MPVSFSLLYLPVVHVRHKRRMRLCANDNKVVSRFGMEEYCTHFLA
jgi:hypothetical protein